MLSPILLKITPTEQFPQLFLADYPELEKLSDIKVRFSVQYIKINSQWIMYISVKSKSIRHLQGNIGEKLYICWLGKYFLDMTLKTQSIKEQIDK